MTGRALSASSSHPKDVWAGFMEQGTLAVQTGPAASFVHHITNVPVAPKNWGRSQRASGRDLLAQPVSPGPGGRPRTPTPPLPLGHRTACAEPHDPAHVTPQGPLIQQTPASLNKSPTVPTARGSMQGQSTPLTVSKTSDEAAETTRERCRPPLPTTVGVYFLSPPQTRRRGKCECGEKCSVIRTQSRGVRSRHCRSSAV